MLPLVSSITTTVTGCTSLLKSVNSCGLRSSKTSKCWRSRSGTSRPLESTTVA